TPMKNKTPFIIKCMVPTLIMWALAGALRAPAQTVTLLSSDAKLIDPGAVTTDETNIYIANGTTLLRVPMAGGAATIIASGVSPCCVVGLTVTGPNLFWI